MRLYYSPDSPSLAPHIVLHESEQRFEAVRLDVTKGAAADDPSAAGHWRWRPPVLELESGEQFTEVAAIVQYLADQKPGSGLIPRHGTLERYRVQEWLAIIDGELHPSLRLCHPGREPTREWRDDIERRLVGRFAWLETKLRGRSYLTGARFCVADAYLFTVLSWTRLAGIPLARWPVLGSYAARVFLRPKVRQALATERVAVPTLPRAWFVDSRVLLGAGAI